MPQPPAQYPSPPHAALVPPPATQVVNHLKQRYGKQPGKVLNVVMGSKGGVSGGTIAR